MSWSHSTLKQRNPLCVETSNHVNTACFEALRFLSRNLRRSFLGLLILQDAMRELNGQVYRLIDHFDRLNTRPGEK